MDARIRGRNGRVLALAAVAAGLAGCAAPPDNPARTGAAGVTEIAVSDGRNCHAGDCFTLDMGARTVTRPNMLAAAVPARIDLSDGWVTVTEFRAMHEAARLAPQYFRRGAGI